MPPVPPPDDQPTKPKSALDIVVNQLVRASVGGNIPSSLSDDDLDKYVADLIMKEASAKNKLFNKEGLRAYLPHTETSPGNLPKANKRFLFNVIKSVDGHNQALIKKSEEDAAAARMRDIEIVVEVAGEDREGRNQGMTTILVAVDTVILTTVMVVEVAGGDREGRNQGMTTILVVVDTVILTTVKKKFLGQGKENEEVDLEIMNIDVQADYCEMSNSDMSISPISMSPKINCCSASELSKSAPVIVRKGRGEVSDGSKMDKYFEKDYDPMYDFEKFAWLNYVAVNKKASTKPEDFPLIPELPEEIEKVEKIEKKKKKKKHHKEKSKKHLVREWDMPKLNGCWDLESLKTNEEVTYNGVREWDKPKLASGSWDPENVKSKDDEKKLVYDGVREWDKPKLAGSWDPEDSSE
ncbi:16614_t:CDS:2 [Gigaspora margarita]|uniref:16614_t:CDS:1 n=1 Tax=Gigaspora margarita TaxID=4874 RepID=A0ABN7VB95_GIGMA|nr:16614_t:CDS:2 [Gigaspora margarita]